MPARKDKKNVANIQHSSATNANSLNSKQVSTNVSIDYIKQPLDRQHEDVCQYQDSEKIP